MVEICEQEVALRQSLSAAQRIVIKIGSRVLVDEHGKPELARIGGIVADISALQRQGLQVVIVSSGAVGAGIGALNLKARPKSIPELQMTAAVGQCRLLSIYERLFGQENITVGQVLLTHEDVKDRDRHLHTRDALLAMLQQRTIPIVNENDTVAVSEIAFGDNDMLSALVAMMVEAELLIILSSTDGVKDGKGADASRLSYIPNVDESVLRLAHGKNGELSTGGMRSKLEAVKMVVNSGIPAVIVRGQTDGILRRIYAGESVGTVIGQIDEQGKYNSKKRWLAYYQRAEGAVVINKNAVRALLECNSSLLPVGVVGVNGYFARGSVIDIVDEDGRVVGRGVSSYGSEQARRIKGHRSGEIKQVLGYDAYEELIHRDNLVLL